MIEKNKPTFRPVLNEKSQNMMRYRKTQFDHSPLADRSINLSYMENSQSIHNNKRGTPTARSELNTNPAEKA